MDEKRERSTAAEWGSLAFWTVILCMMAAGGFFAWRYLHDVPEQARREQCHRSCAALNSEYVDVTDYGCFCTDGEFPFILEIDRVNIDRE